MPDNTDSFHIVLIKPSHYGEDVYPIRWLRSAIPSNTLACLNGIAEDRRRREVLGPGVDIRIEIIDETNRRVRPDRIMRRIERAGGRALIALIAVQSNQYPRAVDIGRPFRTRGYPICIAGFHVPGCISMLDEMHVSLRDTQDLGISLFAGEAEDKRFDEVLIDAWRGGVSHVFIGLENINPDSRMGAKKRQNKITDYRDMLVQWKTVGVITLAAYIIGFPNDTPETIRRDIEIIKRELPIDILEFFILTPLPGSEDHKLLYAKGADLDPDLNKYDLCHVVADHPKMSWAALYKTFLAAWDWYYTPDHMETVMRRSQARGVSVGKTMFTMLRCYFSIRHARVLPLEGGYFRLRSRKDRRPTLKRENPLVFYPRYLMETASNHFWMAIWLARMGIVRQRIRREGDAAGDYTDLALTPPTDGELDDLALFAETRGGAQAVDKKHKEDAARESVRSAAE